MEHETLRVAMDTSVTLGLLVVQVMLQFQFSSRCFFSI